MLYEFADYNMKDKFARGVGARQRLRAWLRWRLLGPGVQEHAQARGAKPYAKLVERGRRLRTAQERW